MGNMRRIRLFAMTIVVSLFFVGLLTGRALAAGQLTADEAEYCIQAQRLITGVDITAENKIYADHEAFVESKVRRYPLQVQQFQSNPVDDSLNGSAGLNKVLSCKMATSGSIVAAYGDQGETIAEGEDTSCDLLIRTMLSEVAAEVPAADRALDPAAVLVDEEDLNFMGSTWVNPWPFEPAEVDADGKLHLMSRALYVPWSIFIPAPAAFKGVYYCHLPAPDYVKALLQGAVEAPLRSQ